MTQESLLFTSKKKKRRRHQRHSKKPSTMLAKTSYHQILALLAHRPLLTSSCSPHGAIERRRWSRVIWNASEGKGLGEARLPVCVSRGRVPRFGHSEALLPSGAASQAACYTS